MPTRRPLVTVLRANALAIAGAASALAALAWLGLGDFAFNDYDAEASAAVRALTGGHLGTFLALAPAYGGSLALRSPFAFLPGLWGGGELAVYRMLALPCLLAAGALAVWLAARMRRLGRGRGARAAAMALLVASPVTLYALQLGHAEEILAAVACVAAALSARAGRWPWAGVLIGLAVATKSWALVAVAPVLVALPAHRLRAGAMGAAVAAAILAPFVAWHALHASGGAAGALGASSGPIFEPTQAWWWLGSHAHVVRATSGRILPGFRVEPGWLPGIAHPLLVLVAVPLSLLWLRRRRGRALEPLALLTLVLMLRCLLDPWNNYSYAVPFLFALTTWESLQRREGPAFALAATALTWFTFDQLRGHVSPDALSATYLAWMVPLAGGVAVWLYAPALLQRLAAALARGPSRRRSAAWESG